MSRSKPRISDEIHKLKRELEEKNKEINKLNRQLNNEQKKEKTTKKANSKEVVKETTPEASGCPECSQGKIQIIDLGFRKMLSCTLVCGYRKVIKNG